MRAGNNPKIAAHETTAILVAKNLVQRGYLCTLEHLVSNPKTDTIADLRSEVMVKDLQIAAAYGGNVLLLWAMFQSIGALAIISGATSVI